MRSSKSRSRSKGNRNRSVGNIVNRVFDSSGPEGKVRGTPQQIIEKYNQLARDAQLSNDRVAAENFQQHAEHYLRMLSEAQKEQQERQQQHQQNQQNNNGQQGGGDQGQNDGQNENRGGDDRQGDQRRDRSERNRDRDYHGGGDTQGSDDVIDTGEQSDAGLVETPEEKPKRQRKPRKPKAEEQPNESQATPDAAE